MRRTASIAVVIGLGISVTAQENIHFVPADRVAVRMMRDVPAVDLAPGVHVRTIVGATGSFSFGEFEPGSAAPVHHHTREQANVGISGVLDVRLGMHFEPMGPGTGMIIPPNVTHSLTNMRSGVMTIIEFHTVPRPDLVPPRPAMTFPASPEPAPFPNERRIIVPLDKSGAGASAAPGMIVGETSTMGWFTLGAAPTSIRGDRMRGELFIYVVRGDAQLTASSGDHRAGPGSLVVVPAAEQRVAIRAAGANGAAVVVFSPERPLSATR